MAAAAVGGAAVAVVAVVVAEEAAVVAAAEVLAVGEVQAVVTDRVVVVDHSILDLAHHRAVGALLQHPLERVEDQYRPFLVDRFFLVDHKEVVLEIKSTAPGIHPFFYLSSLSCL